MTPISPVPVITTFRPVGAAGAVPNRVASVLSPAKPLTKNRSFTSRSAAASHAGRVNRPSVTAPCVSAGPVVYISGKRAVNSAPRASSVM